MHTGRVIPRRTPCSTLSNWMSKHGTGEPAGGGSGVSPRASGRWRRAAWTAQSSPTSSTPVSLAMSFQVHGSWHWSNPFKRRRYRPICPISDRYLSCRLLPKSPRVLSTNNCSRTSRVITYSHLVNMVLGQITPLTQRFLLQLKKYSRLWVDVRSPCYACWKFVKVFWCCAACWTPEQAGAVQCGSALVCELPGRPLPAGCHSGPVRFQDPVWASAEPDWHVPRVSARTAPVQCLRQWHASVCWWRRRLYSSVRWWHSGSCEREARRHCHTDWIHGTKSFTAIQMVRQKWHENKFPENTANHFWHSPKPPATPNSSCGIYGRHCLRFSRSAKPGCRVWPRYDVHCSHWWCAALHWQFNRLESQQTQFTSFDAYCASPGSVQVRVASIFTAATDSWPKAAPASWRHAVAWKSKRLYACVSERQFTCPILT